MEIFKGIIDPGSMELSIMVSILMTLLVIARRLNDVRNILDREETAAFVERDAQKRAERRAERY